MDDRLWIRVTVLLIATLGVLISCAAFGLAAAEVKIASSVPARPSETSRKSNRLLTK